MKAFLNYLAPLSVLAAMAALGFRPTWESVGALVVAVGFMVAERVLEDRRDVHGAQIAAKNYAEEVKALRAEQKLVTDAVKQALSSQALRGRF